MRHQLRSKTGMPACYLSDIKPVLGSWGCMLHGMLCGLHTGRACSGPDHLTSKAALMLISHRHCTSQNDVVA